jgi:hypothetical protein
MRNLRGIAGVTIDDDSGGVELEVFRHTMLAGREEGAKNHA